MHATKHYSAKRPKVYPHIKRHCVTDLYLNAIYSRRQDYTHTHKHTCSTTTYTCTCQRQGLLPAMLYIVFVKVWFIIRPRDESWFSASVFAWISCVSCARLGIKMIWIDARCAESLWLILINRTGAARPYHSSRTSF